MPFVGLLFSFFGGPLGKIAGYVLAIGAIIGALWIALKVYDDNVANAARAAFNAQQLAIVQQENTTYKQQIAELTAKETDLNAQLAAADFELDNQTQKIITVIKTTPPSACFDPIFNKTLTLLKANKRKK